MLIIADSKIVNAESAFSSFGVVRTLRTPEILRDAVNDADILLVRSETHVNSSLLEGTRIGFVGTATIGTDHVDVEYLEHRRIRFASCPGSNANSVAEYVLASLLEVSAQFNLGLRGKTLGVVGYGNTGSRVAKKAEAIGMTVVLNDPPLQRETGSTHCRPLDELMEADFISLHVPLTKTGIDATYHLFDEHRLSALKDGCVLVNSSRGAVVETQALKKALRSGRLRASVLDVWEGEPLINTELLECVGLGTPHIAGYSYDGKLNATIMLQRAIAEAFNLTLTPESEPSAVALQRLSVPENQSSMEETLRQVVKQCYDIREDDTNLRSLLQLPSADAAEHFRKLRATYRTRREFHNFVVEGSRCDEVMRTIFRSVGFNIK